MVISIPYQGPVVQSKINYYGVKIKFSVSYLGVKIGLFKTPLD
jgi:hypothetical protein